MFGGGEIVEGISNSEKNPQSAREIRRNDDYVMWG